MQREAELAAIDRRGFVKGLGGLTLLGTLGPLLISCGGDPESATRTSTLQLGWLPNVESMAPIIADEKGYYSDAGVDLKLKPGGPEVVVEPQIVSGKVLAGIQASDKLADSVQKGADLVAIGAMYQSSPSCILSLKKKPISKPKDLEGKRFGISQSDARVYDAFFKLAGVDGSKVEKVPTGADPAALASGDVDAMSAVLPNQPVALQIKGVQTHSLRLADYGYNRWSGLLSVKKATLDDDAGRAAVVAMLKGTAEGMKDCVTNPTAAAKLVVKKYGKPLGLDPEAQTRAAKIWASLAQTKTTKEHGLLRITPDGIRSQQEFFDALEIHVQADDLFDTSIGDEVLGKQTNG